MEGGGGQHTTVVFTAVVLLSLGVFLEVFFGSFFWGRTGSRIVLYTAWWWTTHSSTFYSF